MSESFGRVAACISHALIVYNCGYSSSAGRHSADAYLLTYITILNLEDCSSSL